MRRASLGAIAAIALWLAATKTGLISELFLPSPDAVFLELWSMVVSGDILRDAVATTLRTLTGFALGLFGGIVLGLLMGTYRPAYDYMELPLDFLRSIPATALFPLFIVIWGLGDSVKVFVAAWASGMVILINTIYGARSVSPVRLQMARLRRATKRTTFLSITLPESLPFIVAGCRLGLSLALVVEIVAEMFLGSSSGLGHRIFNASSVFQMEEAYATVFIVGALGYSANKLVVFASERFVHWT